MKLPRTPVSALAAAAALAAPAAAHAQDAPPSIRLTPARAAGVIERGQTIGPFTILNDTEQSYSVRVFPVLLGQDRKGGLRVNDTPVALRIAAFRLAVQVRGFPFGPGVARSVFGRVRRARRGQGFYGGILFRATPRPGGGGQITNVLQINGRITLDPPVPQRRYRWQGGAVRAEQDGVRRLRMLVPVTNRGNTFALVDGSLRVRAVDGRVVAALPLQGLRILPGATVDLPARLRVPVLPAGRYTLEASVGGLGPRATAAGAMDLFGPNEVRTERARIVSFEAPKAYIGDSTEVEASFVNTGNVRWEPRASLEARALRGDGQAGAVVARAVMDSSSVAPGARGTVSARISLPEGTRSFELRVRLATRDARELDSRATSVTPVKRPPLLTRISDWVTEHAILVVLLILAGVAIAAVFIVRYIRRLQAAARQ